MVQGEAPEDIHPDLCGHPQCRSQSPGTVRPGALLRPFLHACPALRRRRMKRSGSPGVAGRTGRRAEGRAWTPTDSSPDATDLS